VTTTTLATALTDCAAGLYPLEAGVALLITEGTCGHPQSLRDRDGSPSHQILVVVVERSQQAVT
jgi:hypothetical protein